MMVTVTPLNSMPTYSQILVPSSTVPLSAVPNGTPVTRPSDGCQWTVTASSLWPQPPWTQPQPMPFQNTLLTLSLVTPPTDPVQTIAVTDSLNIGD